MTADTAPASLDRTGPPRRYQAQAVLAASPDQVFERLDDQTRLAAHMQQPSAMMGGGRMSYTFDEGQGRQVGSHIKMGGSAFGVTLYVDEVVTERDTPRRKVWRTVGASKLLIIAGYEMGFETWPRPEGAGLRVWIDYTLPKGLFGRVLGWLFAGLYSRWCVTRMVEDAKRAFGPNAAGENS